MHYVSDALFDGWRLWALSKINNFSHKNLAEILSQGIGCERIVEVAADIIERSGWPGRIFLDNGPESVGCKGRFLMNSLP